MSAKGKKKKVDIKGLLTIGVICSVLVVAVVLLLKVMLSDSGSMKKTRISTVTLLKPPPPPEVKEKLPEPEVVKQEQKVETPIQTPQDAPQNDQPADNTPPGADLGVDAEGSAGSDGFGLVGKKGGRALTLGGGGGGPVNRLSLMSKYGWYTAKIQDEVKRHMRRKLDAEGGIPKGKLQATIKIVLDPKGSIVKYQIIASSGDSRMDEALKASLAGFRISQPPPEGMPQGMTIRITSQG